MSLEHDVIPIGELHKVANWQYANAAARAAATGFIATDVGKFAWQQNNNTFWVLTDESPITWAQIGLLRSVILTADETNATATLANLGLSLPLISGANYRFRLTLIVNEDVAGDGAKVDFDGSSAGVTLFRAFGRAYDTTPALLMAQNVAAKATDFTIASLNGDGQIVIEGAFTPSSDGTIIPRFAQNSHSTGTLTVRRGSSMEVWEQ